MRVLVTAATRHGSTDEIALAIGRVLGEHGLDVSVMPADAVLSLEAFDGVVIGSGVYLGRWLEPARRFVERHEAELSRRPVWLFSTGPVGDPLAPEDEPADAAPIRELIGARDHRVFPGRLDKHALGLAERAIVGVVHAPEGDYRDWPEIEAWAAGIAAELGAVKPDDPVVEATLAAT